MSFVLLRGILIVLFISCILADSCDECLSYKKSLTVDTEGDTFAQYSLILDYGYQLCNRSFSHVEQLKRCITRAEQYAKDRVRDIIADAERHETVTIVLDSMCEVLTACSTSCCLSSWEPEQVHIAIGGETSMTIMWTTQNELGVPSVAYWPNLTVNSKRTTSNSAVSIEINFANATSFTYDTIEWTGHIYMANLTNLPSLTNFNYQLCGISNTGYACFPTVRNFTSTPAPSTAPLTARFTANSNSLLPWIPGETAAIACLFGDISTESNAEATSLSLAELALNSTIQLVAVAGDMAYADGTISVWDQYMRMIEQYAAYVPVLTAPGNHEHYYDFVSYYSRFTMPVAASNSPSKQYHSFNYEKIHFVSFSVEEDDGASLLPGGIQRVWLESDLALANTQRDVRPWIILFGHRPFYCSSDSVDCTQVAQRLRDLLEDLINKYHIDVVISGHKHNYERTYPVYRSAPTSTSYANPDAPVYFVVGTGGVDKNSDFVDPEPNWSAHRDDKYGYLLASAPNANTLQLYYFSKSFNVHDSATIERTVPITNWSFTH